LVYVNGAGFTRIGLLWKYDLEDLAVEAALKALEDSKVGSVDAILVGNMASGVLNGQENLGAVIADALGMAGVPSIKVEAACGSGGAAVMWAAISIMSGLFDSVLVVGVEKMTDVTDVSDQTSALATAANARYEASLGASFPSLNALIMREYMKEHGLLEEDFAHLPVLMHENAANAEHAQLRFRISIEDYLRSPYISEPLRLLDSAPIGDGAAALVISSKRTDESVEISGFGAATDVISICQRDSLTRLRSVELAAKRALKMASLKMRDVDLVQIHDAFSVMGYLNLEALGVAERGKAHVRVEKGDFNRDGWLPINPEGGLKARGHPVGATGVYQVAEIYLQLTDRAGRCQVEGAETAIAVNIGGTGSNAVVNVLRRC